MSIHSFERPLAAALPWLVALVVGASAHVGVVDRLDRPCEARAAPLVAIDIDLQAPARPISTTNVGSRAVLTIDPSCLGPRGSQVAPVLLFGVRQLGPTEFVVEREAVRSLLELPARELARFVPFVREGVPAGVKLYGVRECSPLRLLGLQNGDRLARIDGVPLDDGSVFASATRRVNASDRVRLDLERRGQSLTLWYALE